MVSIARILVVLGLVLILVGGLVYLFSLYLFDRPTLIEIKQTVITQFKALEA